MYGQKLKNHITSSTLIYILNEITNIHNLLIQHRKFSAGFEFGRLQTELSTYIVQLQKKEVDEDNEDEDEDEEEKYEKLRFKVRNKDEDNNIEIIRELRDFNEYLKKSTIELEERNSKLLGILEDLIKNDHIYPGRLDEIIRSINKACPEESVDDLYSLLPGRTVRMPDGVAKTD